MDKILYRILFMALTCLLAACLQQAAYSQEEQEKEAAIKQSVIDFAKKALEGYVNNALNEENVARFGFKNLEEARTATLGKPRRVLIIGLRDLKQYKPGTPVKRLLLDVKIYWFPVMVGREVRTKLEIIEKEDKLVAGEFGKVNMVREVVSAEAQMPKLLEAKGIEEQVAPSILKIPALQAMFLYIEYKEQEFLVPAMAQPQRHNLAKANFYTADEVLSELSKVAQEIDEKKIR